MEEVAALAYRYDGLIEAIGDWIVVFFFYNFLEWLRFEFNIEFKKRSFLGCFWDGDNGSLELSEFKKKNGGKKKGY